MSDEEMEGWDPTRPAFDAADGSGRGDGPPREEPAGRSAGSGPADDPARPTSADEAPASGGDAAGGADAPGPEPEAPLLASHMDELAALASRAADELERDAARYARWVLETFRSGGKLILCGNGGSAATTEHAAAEYAVRFRRRRRPLPAVALSASGSAVTAAGNDFGFEETFARQLRAQADSGDLLVVHSTSGESENVVRAVNTATEMSLRSVGLLAGGGGRLASLVSLALVVPTDETARAQEIHMALEHAVADRVDAVFGGEPE